MEIESTKRGNISYAKSADIIHRKKKTPNAS